MNDARYPWLILVPRIKDAREIVDLPRSDQHRLMDEIARVSEALQSVCDPTKLNIGALGNRVGVPIEGDQTPLRTQARQDQPRMSAPAEGRVDVR